MNDPSAIKPPGNLPQAGASSLFGDADTGPESYAGPDRANPKVRQLLDAAHLLFLDQPYDQVSTDAIAKAAKVSKATLYVYFPSKEALFGALIAEQCGQIAADVWKSTSDGDNVEAVLRKIAHNFVAMFATGEKLELYRIIIAQVPRFPELGRLFYESGPAILHKRIAAFLAAATHRGHLNVPDPQLAAIQFLHLVAGNLPMTGMLGRVALNEPDTRRLVDGGIALFMAGYGPDGRIAAAPT